MNKIHFHLVLTKEEEAKLAADFETCSLTKSAYLRRFLRGAGLRRVKIHALSAVPARTLSWRRFHKKTQRPHLI